MFVAKSSPCQKSEETRNKDMIDSLFDLSFTKEYLLRIGAVPRTLFTAVIEKKLGKRYWEDQSVIKFDKKTGFVSVFPKSNEEEYEPTKEEQSLISTEWKDSIDLFPKIKYLPLNLLDDHLNEDLQKAMQEKRLFVFEDPKGEFCLMLEERIDVSFNNKNGKRYVRWSYWSDKKWRKLEAVDNKGKIPLYGLSQLKDHSIVFLHEGAKSADACKNLSEDHPWYDVLKDGAHIGWVGGALNPHRTSWRALRNSRPDKVYIIPDNDTEGYSSVPHISKELDCVCYSVQWPDNFPARFDLADPFPNKMYKNGKYTGCSFEECLTPATFLTKLVLNESGKISMELRSHAKNFYVHVLKSDQWVCKDNPNIVLEESLLKKTIRKFHHNIGGPFKILDLFKLTQNKEYVRFSYRPDKYEQGAPGIISDGEFTFNKYHPGPVLIHNVKSNKQYNPWEEFLEYLLPVDEERDHAKRWIATLIARPEIRMKWSMLMISYTQGIGKSTLGEGILMPLVGMRNSSVVRESDILSAFNSWAAFRRLIVIEEIYAGQSWKAYQLLQSVITDPFIRVNEKHTRTFTCENWCHVFACSNEHKALKVSRADRRWFFPEVSEVRWPDKKFDFFYNWLHSNGLGIIKHWAHSYNKYVEKGEHAPVSEKKKEIIQESMSQEEIKAQEVGNFLSRFKEPFMINRDSITDMVSHEMKNQKIFDSDLKIRKAVMSGCMNNHDKKTKLNLFKRNGRIYYAMIKGNRQYLLLNDAMMEKFQLEKMQGDLKMRSFISQNIKTGLKLRDKLRSANQPF